MSSKSNNKKKLLHNSFSNSKKYVSTSSSGSEENVFEKKDIFKKRKPCKKKKQPFLKISDTDSDSDSFGLNKEELDYTNKPNNELTTTIIEQKIDFKKKSAKNSNEIFKELIKRQLSDVPPQWKLNINDMKRICKYIDSSIFDHNQCCIWNGYITNMNNSNKGTYVNFYFRNKKVALHRLLYSNFVAPLDSSEYLKFNCDNKGICCNINHYEKYKYSKNNGLIKREQKQREPKKEIKEITIVGPDEPEKLIIDFD